MAQILTTMGTQTKQNMLISAEISLPTSPQMTLLVGNEDSLHREDEWKSTSKSSSKGVIVAVSVG